MDRTERFLVNAGIRSGMRVLDAGCGGGAVTLIAAELVGPAGEVVGVDRAAGRLDQARARARDRGMHHVSFVAGDFDAVEGPFDAVVARRVLKYQPDPVAAVAQLAKAVRPGGTVVFEEICSGGLPIGAEDHPLHARVHRWIWAALDHLGAELTMGLKLHPTFLAAGLLDIHVVCEAIVQTAEQGRPIVQILQRIVPILEEAGLATAAEVDLDTLEGRLAAERQASGGTFVGDLVYCAWGTVPG